MEQGTSATILEAAVDVYANRGSRGFSMRAVAARAGITATAIYRHYPDKAALAVALVERARRLLGGYLLAGVSGDDPLERLWSTADGYVRFSREYPQLYRLLFMEPIDGPLPDVHEMQSGRQALPFRLVIDRIREAMAEGYLAEGDPGGAALSVWAHVHGLCTLALAGRIPGDDLQSLCRSSLAHLYDGLGRRDRDA